MLTEPLKLILALTSFLCFTTCDNPPDTDLIEWQRGKTKWDKLNSSSYTYNFRASCFCIEEWVKEVTITVTADTISSVVFTDNQQQPTQIKPYQWYTVDKLFDIAKTVLDEAYTYELEFDSELGYPTLISVDWLKDAVDDEVTYYASNLNYEKN